MLTRRNFLAAASAALPARRPNVVLVLVDQWRAQAAGYSGDANARTPALDRLAGESANFVNAISGCAVCSPYRGSLMTGQYPLTHGVFINDVPLAPKGPTLAQVFGAAGYRTGYIGKWHLLGSPDGAYGRRRAFVPREKRFGFDYWKAFECSHNYNKSEYFEGDDQTVRLWDGYDAIAQTRDACGFIERSARAADPFLLVVSLGPPHSPYGTAPESYRARYADRTIQLRPNVPEPVRRRSIEDLRGYYAHIAALDDCVARFTATLEKGGVAEDTILVFTSDHGDMLGSHGLTAKQHPWDESVRVPFLVRYPRALGRRGRVIRQPIDAPDIMPTLLGLAGLAIPGHVQGEDLSGVARGTRAEDPQRGALINMAAPFTQVRRCGFAPFRGLRTATHTYVRAISGPWLLYDNARDPYQMHNLCGRGEGKAALAILDRQLEARLKQVNDDFLPAAAYLERAGLQHYREANVPVGRCTSPWNDWQATWK
ncbi:MAG: sulfatase [Bryobacteraceae bacterium]